MKFKILAGARANSTPSYSHRRVSSWQLGSSGRIDSRFEMHY